MKKVFNYSLILLFLGGTFTACKKKGCTDSTANNYDSNAKKNDGSCTYDPIVVIPPATSINSDPTYSYTLDGTLIEHPGATGSVQGVNGSDKSIGTSNTTASWSYGFYDDALSYTVLNLSKGIKVYANGSMTDTEYSNYFAAGSYPFATSGGSGIVIQVGDAAGNYYQSDLGDQTGSSFQIVDKLDEFLGGTLYVKTFSQFNCKVYNINDVTDVKTITGGEMVCHFSDI